MLISSEPNTFQIGLDGFVWYMGVVEDVGDPIGVGRAKVRIFGWHDESLATHDLPYAYPLRPLTQSRTNADIRVGDWVVGFFMDGKIGQQPIMLGVLPSIPQSAGLLGNVLGSITKEILSAETGGLSNLVTG